MKRKSFMQIFWGFLFVFLDFTFDGIDLIPDFVGYIFIVIGLRSLSSLSLHFTHAKISAIILFFLSLFTDFSILTPLKPVASNTGNATDWTSLLSLIKEKWFIPLFLFTVISRVLEFILLWKICEGISKVATESGNQTFAKIAKNRRNLYAGLGVLYIGVGLSFLSFYTGLLPPYFFFSKIVYFIVISIVVYTFVVICLLMDLIRKASLEIK
jgi:hypothetical protein